MERQGLGTLLSDRRRNAVGAWILVALVLVAGAGSFLRGNLLWPVFTAVVACIAVLPAVSLRNPQVMPPWEVMLLASLPIVGRLFTTTLVTGRIATYLSVAALALLVAVDLGTFTAVEMNDTFAVLFVVVTTLATAGIWAVVRWVADLYLGTAYIESEHALMLEFVASTIAGLVAGLVYVFYLRHRTDPELRFPDEVEVP